MSTTEDLSHLAETLSNQEFQQFIISKMKWFVQNKELMMNFIVNNDNAKDVEKDISNINRIIRARFLALSKLPNVLICEISTFLPIKEYLNFAGTAKVFFTALNNKNGTHLSKLDVTQNWSNKQLEKHLDRHRNLLELNLFTDQLINDENEEINFKLYKLHNLSLKIQNGGVNFLHKSVIESKYWQYENIVRLSLNEYEEADNQQQDIMQIRHILSKCNHLSSLRLVDFYVESPETIQWIINDHDVALPKLVELNMQNSVGFALIIKFGHQLKKLSWFNMYSWSSNWYPITHSERFNYLKKCNFKQLQQLRVSAIHYNDMNGILTTAINLKKFEITNDGHYYEGEIEKTLKDLIKLIFIRCKKLVYFKLNFLEWKSKGKNSHPRAYDGIIEGLKDTKQLKRDTFMIELNMVLSLKHLTQIVNTFKLSKTKKMTLHYKGWLYHDFESITLEKESLYKELDYKKEKPLKLVNDTLQKLFDDDGSHEFDLIDLQKRNQNIHHPEHELQIELTLVTKK